MSLKKNFSAKELEEIKEHMPLRPGAWTVPIYLIFWLVISAIVYGADVRGPNPRSNAMAVMEVLIGFIATCAMVTFHWIAQTKPRALQRWFKNNFIGNRMYIYLNEQGDMFCSFCSRYGSYVGSYDFVIDLGGWWFPKAYPNYEKDVNEIRLKRPRSIFKWIESSQLEVLIEDKTGSRARMSLYVAMAIFGPHSMPRPERFSHLKDWGSLLTSMFYHIWHLESELDILIDQRNLACTAMDAVVEKINQKDAHRIRSPRIVECRDTLSRILKRIPSWFRLPPEELE